MEYMGHTSFKSFRHLKENIIFVPSLSRKSIMYSMQFICSYFLGSHWW